MLEVVRYFLCLFVICSFVACKDTVVHDLNEHEANRALLKLSVGGISGQKIHAGSGWGIQVDTKEYQSALKILAQSRTWQRKSRAGKKQKKLLYSKEERRHLIERSLAEQLEETLRQIPSVLEARVHVFLSTDSYHRAKNNEIQNSSASVLLLSNSKEKVSHEKVKAIVSGAAGISIEQIKVVEFYDELEVPRPVVRASAHSLTLLPEFKFRPQVELQVFVILFLAFVLLLLRRRRRRAEVLSRICLDENSKQ